MSGTRVLSQWIRATSLGARQSWAHHVVRGGGGHHHGPAPPPFARLPVPSQKLLEEHELVWNDGVAPELAIDFDAPHISRSNALKAWLRGLSFFPVLMGLIWLYDPESTKFAVSFLRFYMRNRVELVYTCRHPSIHPSISPSRIASLNMTCLLTAFHGICIGEARRLVARFEL